ncbi:MAG: hypothetical protein RXR41_00615 [Candidatus Marsarchaeota archaeon]
MPSSGQLLGNEGRGSISPAMPGEGIGEVVQADRKTNAVRCYQTVFQERELGRLADLSAEPFNELDYERRQGFFQKRDVDLKGMWDECYER